MADPRDHERWIWGGANHEHLYPIDSQGKPLRAICVIGPDTIHPNFGFNWWQQLRPKDLDTARLARDAIVDHAYAEIRDSELSLSEATEYIGSVYKYRCLGLCATFESLCSLRRSIRSGQSFDPKS